MPSIQEILLFTAIVTNGLLAGLFFVFTVAINPGLRRVNDTTYVRTFRAINSAILNGWFLTVFFVAPLSAVAYAVSAFRQMSDAPMWSAWTAATCAVLTFGITTMGNVPLNTRLNRATVHSDPERDIARTDFEVRWNRWNLARTLTSFGALVGLTLAATLR